MSYPHNPTKKLGQDVLKNVRYLVVIVSRQGLINMLECPGLPWCVNGFRVGRQLPDALLAIVDVCDESVHTQLFRYVQLAEAVWADVHVIKNDTKTQIILHDVSVAHAGEHKYQQQAHDARLLLEQQGELNRLLEAKFQEVDEANRAKNRFIAAMSDEFRTPISSIMTHAEALQAKSSEAREPAAIRRASWYLLTLLENLLETARVDESARKLDISNVEIPPLIKDMQELFEAQVTSNGLRFVLEISENVRLVVADDLRLRQVLVNLINNAVRCTRRGHVGLCCRRLGDAVEFSVIDSGADIDELDIDRNFEKSTEFEPRDDSGEGLGLTVSRQLVKAMGSDLCVTSRSDQGTTFSFTLPVPVEDQQKSFESLQNLNVLVVEYNLDAREMYRSLLEQWGAHVCAVASCDQAKTAFENDPPDLVLTDLFLDDGNGVDLLTAFRAKRPGLATVLCSSSESVEIFLGKESRLVDAFIRKPLSAKRLKSALQRATNLEETADARD